MFMGVIFSICFIYIRDLKPENILLDDYGKYFNFLTNMWSPVG